MRRLKDEETGLESQSIVANRQGELKQKRRNDGFKFFVFAVVIVISLVLTVNVLKNVYESHHKNMISALQESTLTNAAQPTNLDSMPIQVVSRDPKKVDKCKKLWTLDQLSGRCFGLVSSPEVVTKRLDIRNFTINDADTCKHLCCNLGHECITWQYWAGKNLCKVGGQVRLGLEAAKTPLWCDPAKPVVWNGKRISSRFPDNETCSWGSDVPTQCFGLGPERKNKDVALSADQCEKECCEDKNCKVWQHSTERGCYFNKEVVNDIFCEPYTGSYTGGRKNMTLLFSHQRVLGP